MVDHIGSHLGMFGPVEVRTSVERRRRWPEELKGRIVAASFAPGARVADVAREYDISPQHLHLWRRAAKSGKLVVPLDDELSFAAVVVDHSDRPGRREHRVIEVEVAGALIRVEEGSDLRRVAEIARALKAVA